MSSVFRILPRFEYVFLYKIIKLADKKPEDDNKVYLEEVKNEISSRIRYLKYTVIPAIKKKIDSLV